MIALARHTHELGHLDSDFLVKRFVVEAFAFDDLDLTRTAQAQSPAVRQTVDAFIDFDIVIAERLPQVLPHFGFHLLMEVLDLDFDLHRHGRAVLSSLISGRRARKTVREREGSESGTPRPTSEPPIISARVWEINMSPRLSMETFGLPIAARAAEQWPSQQIILGAGRSSGVSY